MDVPPLDCHGVKQDGNAPGRQKDYMVHRCCAGHNAPLSLGQTPGPSDVSSALQVSDRLRDARRLPPPRLNRHIQFLSVVRVQPLRVFDLKAV